MNACSVRTATRESRSPVLTSQGGHGPVVMLVGGRLTQQRPHDQTTRRAPASGDVKEVVA